MRTDRLWKHVLISSAIAAVLYIAVFTWLERRRSHLGPWEVTFVNKPPATAYIQIDQPALNIETVRVEFAHTVELPETNVSIQFVPGKAVPFEVPFGECVFLDPTFLPGTVTLQILNHQIEMFPRALRLDGTEYEWQSGSRIQLPTTAEELPEVED